MAKSDFQQPKLNSRTLQKARMLMKLEPGTFLTKSTCYMGFLKQVFLPTQNPFIRTVYMCTLLLSINIPIQLS